MRDDLSDRISMILEARSPDPTEIQGLVAETEAALADATKRREEARAKALDPTTKAALVPQARGDIFELDFRIERLTVALDRLRALHESAIIHARDEAKRQVLLEVMAERDQLAAELVDRYPTLASELADLLARVRANDARAIPLGLDRAEGVARSIPGNGYVKGSPVEWLVDAVRLPVLDPEQGVMGNAIWPPPQRMVVTIPPAMAAMSAARGAEMRQIEEEVTLRRQAEDGSPRHRVG